MRTVSSGATEMRDELESEASEPPPHSPSRLRISNKQSIAKTNLKDNPLLRPLAPQHRSSSNKTPTSASVVGSVFSRAGPSLDKTHHSSLATTISDLDVDLDVTSPNPSGVKLPIAGKVRVPLPELGLADEESMDDGLSPTAVEDARAAARTVLAQSSPLLNQTDLSASGSNDARAAARSAFVENCIPPSNPSPNVRNSSTIAGPSRSNSASPQVLDSSGTLSQASSVGHHSAVRTLHPSANRNILFAPNLRLNTRVTAIQPRNSSSPISEERSPYIETWDEELGRRVSVIDQRPSTVAEHLQDQPSVVHTWVETIEDVFYSIPAALLPSEHSFLPHRAAPVPPTGAERSKNIVKRFVDWIGRFEWQWDARREAKRATKEQKRQKNLERRERRERRQDSIVRNQKNDFAMKEQLAAHKKRQMDLKTSAQEDDMRHKIDSANRVKKLKQARRMQKQEEKIDARNKKRGNQQLPMSGSHLVRGHVKNVLRLYGEGSAITPEAEECKLALSEELDRRIEIVQAKYERKEAERIRQRAGNINVRRQEMTLLGLQGLAAAPRCAQTLHHQVDDSSDDSENVHLQRTDDIENAVRRVPGGVDAMVNVL